MTSPRRGPEDPLPCLSCDAALVSVVRLTTWDPVLYGVSWGSY